MPIYDFQCSCGSMKKDEFVRSWKTIVSCDECGAAMKRTPTQFAPHVFPSDGIHLSNVSSKGKTFYSKKEMREYAKKHDLELGAL